MRTFLLFFLTIGIIGYFYYQSTQEAQPNISKKQFEPSYKNTPLPQAQPQNSLDTIPQTDSVELIETDIDSLLEPVDLQWLIETTLDSFEAGEIISQEWMYKYFCNYTDFSCWEDRKWNADKIAPHFYDFIDLEQDGTEELVIHLADCKSIVLILKKEQQWIPFDTIIYEKYAPIGSCAKGQIILHKKAGLISTLEGTNCGSSGNLVTKSIYAAKKDSIAKIFITRDQAWFHPGFPSSHFFKTEIDLISREELKIQAQLNIYSEHLDTIILRISDTFLFQFDTTSFQFEVKSASNDCIKKALSQEKDIDFESAMHKCVGEGLESIAIQQPQWAGTIDTIMNWGKYMRGN